MTHTERRDRLRAELQQQVGRQTDLENALRQTQAQVLRLQGALAVMEEIIQAANGGEESVAAAE